MGIAIIGLGAFLMIGVLIWVCIRSGSRDKSPDKPEGPTYRIRAIDDYFVVEMYRGYGEWMSMRQAFVEEPNYKRDFYIWLVDTSVAKFSTQEKAKEALDFYLNGDWKKPVNEVVYTYTPEKESKSLISSLIDAVDSGDKEAELKILDKLRVEYKPK